MRCLAEPILRHGGEVDSFIHAHRLESPYLFIDADVVGFSGARVDSWGIREGSALEAVVYRYGSGAHVVASTPMVGNVAAAVSDLLKGLTPEMIQCSLEIAQMLSGFLQQFNFVDGFVFRSTGGFDSHALVSRAQECELSQIAELICDDREIGKHYTVQKLTRQLQNREQHEGCRSYVLRRRGTIVAHAATYAESEMAAVIGGVKAGPQAQKGDGAAVLSSLAAYLEDEGKEAYLYCYIPALWDWYESKGWQAVARVAKLELRK